MHKYRHSINFNTLFSLKRWGGPSETTLNGNILAARLTQGALFLDNENLIVERRKQDSTSAIRLIPFPVKVKFEKPPLKGGFFVPAICINYAYSSFAHYDTFITCVFMGNISGIFHKNNKTRKE
jgi:hypothetical protein